MSLGEQRRCLHSLDKQKSEYPPEADLDHPPVLTSPSQNRNWSQTCPRKGKKAEDQTVSSLSLSSLISLPSSSSSLVCSLHFALINTSISTPELLFLLLLTYISCALWMQQTAEECIIHAAPPCWTPAVCRTQTLCGCFERAPTFQLHN